jgi:uncharacterized membrane protein
VEKGKCSICLKFNDYYKIVTKCLHRIFVWQQFCRIRLNKQEFSRHSTAVTDLELCTALNHVAVHQRIGRMHVNKTIIINRPPEEVYLFWQDYENFSSFMQDLESVRVIGARLLHWKAKAVGGVSAEWDAEIIIEKPFSQIAWSSIKGSDIDNSGSVRFERATGGRGTIVRMEVDYTLPGGAIGATISKFFGEEPGQQVLRTLRAAKQILETGGIVISEASLLPGHSAQPPSDAEFHKPSVVQEYGRDYPAAQ